MRKIPSTNLNLYKNLSIWIPNAPFEANLYHAISLILPRYEQKMLEFTTGIGMPPADHPLYPDMVQFVQQEAAHKRVHTKYNQQLVISGYKIDIVTVIADLNAYIITNFTTNAFKIGVCVAGEHLTGIISVYYESEYNKYLSNSNKNIREIWHWHAIEELEHSQAMFDFFRYHNYSYPTRILSYLASSFWLINPMLILGIIVLSIQDRSIFTKKFWKNTAYTLFSQHGLFRQFIKGSVQYLRKDFHPSENDFSQYVEAYDKSRAAKPYSKAS